MIFWTGSLRLLFKSDDLFRLVNTPQLKNDLSPLNRNLQRKEYHYSEKNRITDCMIRWIIQVQDLESIDPRLTPLIAESSGSGQEPQVFVHTADRRESSLKWAGRFRSGRDIQKHLLRSNLEAHIKTGIKIFFQFCKYQLLPFSIVSNSSIY